MADSPLNVYLRSRRFSARASKNAAVATAAYEVLPSIVPPAQPGQVKTSPRGTPWRLAQGPEGQRCDLAAVGRSDDRRVDRQVTGSDQSRSSPRAQVRTWSSRCAGPLFAFALPRAWPMLYEAPTTNLSWRTCNPPHRPPEAVKQAVLPPASSRPCRRTHTISGEPLQVLAGRRRQP